MARLVRTSRTERLLKGGPMDRTEEFARLRTLATAAAKRLGHRVAPAKPDHDHYVVTLGDGEQSLFWSIRSYPQLRIIISGQFPRWGDRNELTLTSREPSPSITISPQSTPEHAEREVRRRLWPGYLLQLEQAIAQRAEFIAQREQQHHIVQRLEQAGAFTTSRRGHLELRLPERADERDARALLEVSSYSGSVDINLCELTVDQAILVIKALTKDAGARQP